MNIRPLFRHSFTYPIPTTNMDTPAVPMPRDAREREILDSLVGIRDHLLLLKRDRTKYIRTQDVMEIYDQVVQQVRQLNEFRKGERLGENRGRQPSAHLPQQEHARTS